MKMPRQLWIVVIFYSVVEPEPAGVGENTPAPAYYI